MTKHDVDEFTNFGTGRRSQSEPHITTMITSNPTGAFVPLGEPLLIGSRWKENDPRGYSKVKVVIGYDPATHRVHFDGCPKTSARLDRFNGKRNCYKPA